MSVDYFTRQQLMTRGWTRGMLLEFEPDDVVETVSGRVAHLYACSRINQIEQRPKMALRLARVWQRRAAHAVTMSHRYLTNARTLA